MWSKIAPSVQTYTHGELVTTLLYVEGNTLRICGVAQESFTKVLFAAITNMFFPSDIQPDRPGYAPCSYF